MYMKELQGEGNRQIREFVRSDAGCYVGFCAGAYYGSAKVLFDVGGPLEVHEDRELCFFPGNAVGPVFPGFDYASENGARAAWLNVDGDTPPFAVYFNGGCYFESGGGKLSSSSPKQSEVGKGSMAGVTARYANSNGNGNSSEMAAAAVVHRKIGRGAAVLCGVHPEFIPSIMIGANEKQDLAGGEETKSSSCRKGMLQTLAQCDAARVGFLQTILRLAGL